MCRARSRRGNGCGCGGGSLPLPDVAYYCTGGGSSRLRTGSKCAFFEPSLKPQREEGIDVAAWCPSQLRSAQRMFPTVRRSVECLKIEVAFSCRMNEDDFLPARCSRPVRTGGSSLIICLAVSVSDCGIVRNEGINENPVQIAPGFSLSGIYYIGITSRCRSWLWPWLRRFGRALFGACLRSSYASSYSVPRAAPAACGVVRTCRLHWIQKVEV